VNKTRHMKVTFNDFHKLMQRPSLVLRHSMASEKIQGLSTIRGNPDAKACNVTQDAHDSKTLTKPICSTAHCQYVQLACIIVYWARCIQHCTGL